ncbi:MAG: AbrB/MazE/SpoVT family DNA-binding domain-containing protein [Armatimonadota bacterium]
MNIQVGKWGNSYAVRIPSLMAKEMGLKDETELDLQMESGALVLRHIEPKSPVYSLEAMLELMNPEDFHEEVDWGNPVGKEEI